MKTGRVRRREQPVPEEVPLPDQQPPDTASPAPPITPAKTGSPVPMGCIIGAGLGLIALVVILVILFSGGGEPEEWVEATQANGTWTTSVILLGPQVSVIDRWEADCTGDPNGIVQTGSCIMKDSDAYQDTVVDEYEEFAYDIYYDETWSQTYQAQGTEFVATSLGSDDWWEGDRHYTRQEELDTESCEYTNYTIWVDDPQDQTQEAEVYLAQCEVWDHVVETQRVYEQQPWCQCAVTQLVQVGQQDDDGTGASVRWPEPAIPQGGDAQRLFHGEVTFLRDDYTYTVTTDDPGRYEDLMTGQYYIGLKDGQPVGITSSPPQQ